ncbi:MAG: response regulator [Verrucomicrobia bacterium]|nr:response regulator [Verrucomicrobiota bacterium]
MPRILIIDDDPSIRRLITKIISTADVEVIEASDGSEGYTLAAANPPDLILCDVMMPNLDGIGFLQKWSSQATVPSVPIVMITSVTEKSRIIDAVKYGASDYIVKPFDPLGVRTKITKLLKEPATPPPSA